MPNLGLKYRTMSALVHYAVDETLVERLRTAVAASGRDADLNLNVASSAKDRLLFQSVTGSTVVHVARTQARLQTTYFGDFEQPARATERSAYAEKKLGRLLTLLGECGARLTFFGAVVEARLDAPEGQGNELRAVVKDVLHVSPLMMSSEAVYDLSVRISSVHSDDVFSNTSINWFTERVFAFDGPPETAPGLVLNEWDMSPGIEGVELKFDRNNKRGLFAGKRDWTADDFMGIALGAMRDAVPAFGKLESAIATRYDGQKGTAT